MKIYSNSAYLILILIGFILLSACAKEETPEPLDVGTNPDLVAHSAEFKQEIIKVTDGVYVAIAPLSPTKTFSEDHLNLEIAGLKLSLVYAPG